MEKDQFIFCLVKLRREFKAQQSLEITVFAY